MKMGSLGRTECDYWKSFIYLVILAVIYLTGGANTSPISSLSKHNWQQVNTDAHSISKRATRGENLQHVRSLLKLKRRVSSPSSSYSSSSSSLSSPSSKEPFYHTYSTTNDDRDLRAITRLVRLLRQENEELVPLSPHHYPRSSFAGAAADTDSESQSPRSFQKFSREIENHQPESPFDLDDDSIHFDSSPYDMNAPLDQSYSDSQERRPSLSSSSSSSSSPSSSSFGLSKALMPSRLLEAKRSSRWSRLRSRSYRSRINSRGVPPCYLNVVTCF